VTAQKAVQEHQSAQAAEFHKQRQQAQEEQQQQQQPIQEPYGLLHNSRQ
jgi:hypothetical protein